jgi:hypothetical protein
MNRIHHAIWIAVACSWTASTPIAKASNAFTEPCRSAAQREFDFWVGHWRVTENGKLAGRNTIQRVAGGCALHESWVASGQYRGMSLTFFDAARSRWHQTWIGSDGTPLYLEGQSLSKGVLQLSSESMDREGRRQLNRITWTRISDERVRQLWEQRRDTDQDWQVIFDGLYERENKQQPR